MRETNSPLRSREPREALGSVEIGSSAAGFCLLFVEHDGNVATLKPERLCEHHGRVVALVAVIIAPERVASLVVFPLLAVVVMPLPVQGD